MFAAVIRYFKEILQTQLNGELVGQLEGKFEYDDIYWVITVPAIWDLPAKHFMRKAAEKVMSFWKDGPFECFIFFEKKFHSYRSGTAIRVCLLNFAKFSQKVNPWTVVENQNIKIIKLVIQYQQTLLPRLSSYYMEVHNRHTWCGLLKLCMHM